MHVANNLSIYNGIAGLRRVGAPGLADQHGGEERGAQPVAGRVRGDRRGEGRAGRGVPRGRLLRRHRRARRQGLRLLPGTTLSYI
jgi:hypothetical protein